MGRNPLVVVLIVFVWVALAIAYNQIGSHKHIPRNPLEKAVVVRSTRLPFHFSLRSLLIVITLVALMLGIGAYLSGK